MLCICYDEESLESGTEDLSFKLLFTLTSVMQLNPVKTCPCATIKMKIFIFESFMYYACWLACHIFEPNCAVCASIFFIFNALAPNLG